MELLRDKPEFKETIENSFIFRNEIIAIIDGVEAEVDFECDKQELISDIVVEISKHCDDIYVGNEKVGESIKDKIALAIAIFKVVNVFTGEVTIINKKEITEEVLEKVTEFVKENYGLSIKEAYLQSLSII